ncbi:MAG: DUF1800 domain-containing protein [Gemmatimonadaceae bacterium]|jgi:uncharacterized protein (DUF1800 family)|nr:DUF1800 domain-containing protein [Gemmatimonadaceae bacterium]
MMHLIRSVPRAVVLLPLALWGCGAQRPASPSAGGTRSTRALIDSLRALPREMTADQQRWHLLNRLAFGPRPGDVDRVRRTGADAWIDAQLVPAQVADPATDRFVAQFPSLEKDGAALLAQYPPPGAALVRAAMLRGDSTMRGRPDLQAARDSLSAEQRQQLRQGVRQAYQFVGELQSARVGRAVASERQLQEVLTDFWLNHFTVFAGKDRIRYYLPEYEATIRAHALGDFRSLLGAVATSPAMLLYLDNAQSVADSTRPTLGRRVNDAQLRRLAARAPRAQQLPSAQRDQAMEQLLARRPRGLNENYARELLELHTLGVDGGYTQQDVIEVARALTGWTVERGPTGRGGFTFRRQTHDAGAKRILGVDFPAGRGVDEGEAVLDLLARHPSTARFIATKLARRLVSDTPPPAVVARAAATFTATNGNIREVVRVITASPEFWSQTAWRAKVKSPFELVTSAMRALGASADSTPRTAQMMARLGQPMYGHQAPNGWPETGDAWMNTGAILNRINFGMALAGDARARAVLSQWPLTATLSSAPRDAQVDGVVAALFGGSVSTITREVMLTGSHPLMDAARAADTVRLRGTEDAEDTSMAMTGGAGAATAPRRAAMRAGRPVPAGREQAAAAREAVRPERGGSLAQLMGAPTNVTGFAQVVGLALGAPEFQRR